MAKDNTISFGSIWARVSYKRDLSYRYYKYLSNTEKDILDRADLLPEQKLFALKVHSVTKMPMKSCINITNTRYEDYMEWLQDERLNNLPIEKNHKYIRKELEFRGFVPVGKFTMHENNYGYIISNKEIDGTYWVYPKKFASDYKQTMKGKEDINTAFGFIALAGHTKILYKNGYRG
ncbi:MAG: hypothetical protein RSC49_02155 [Clostridium sp.]